MNRVLNQLKFSIISRSKNIAQKSGSEDENWLMISSTDDTRECWDIEFSTAIIAIKARWLKLMSKGI